MKLKQLHNRQATGDKGFTIIEVLIVLVIAGLIMLIVFLAVPALQRNSRNTGRKSEATRLLGAANEWHVNNGRKYPATCVPGVFCLPNDEVVRSGIVGSAGTLSNFAAGSVGILDGITAGQAGDVATNTVYDGVETSPSAALIINKAKCTNNTTIASSSSGFTIVFGVETRNEVTATCISS